MDEQKPEPVKPTEEKPDTEEELKTEEQSESPDLRKSVGITKSGERTVLSEEQVRAIQEEKERKQKITQDNLRTSKWQQMENDDLRESAVVLVPEDDDDFPDDDLNELGSEGEYSYDELDFEPLDEAQQEPEGVGVSLTASQIVLERARQVDSTAEICHIPQPVAQALLQFYQWNKEKLLAEFFNDPDAVYKKSKVAVPNPLRMTSIDVGSDVECQICGDVTDEATGLACKHVFCNLCWGEYLNVKINDNDLVGLHCMAPNCHQVLSDILIQRLVSKEMWSKYARFQASTFVDTNPDMKWCPAPACGNAVHKSQTEFEGKNEVARCTCGFKFCFKCMKDAHTPVDCETVIKWEKKCNDDAETASWMAQNTKPCPKCKVPIEKNDGCFMMTCQSCRHQFCWLCCQDWSTHGDHFSCAKYRGERLENRPKWLGDNDKQTEATDLEKFVAAGNRFKDYQNAIKMQANLEEKISAHKKALMEAGESLVNVGFLDEAKSEYTQLRRTLMWTNVYLFFLSDPIRKDLFAQQQGYLEKFTENLGQELERKAPGTLDRDFVKGMTRVARKNLHKFLTYEM